VNTSNQLLHLRQSQACSTIVSQRSFLDDVIVGVVISINITKKGRCPIRHAGLNQALTKSRARTPSIVSDPLSGNTHDKTAFAETPAAEIIRNSGGGIGDKGYQGAGLATPRKKGSSVVSVGRYP
jgi:hypothetical protein